jgi:hypothetical protein
MVAASDERYNNLTRCRRNSWRIELLQQLKRFFGVNTTAGNTRLGLAYAIISGLLVSALERLARAVALDDARIKFRLDSPGNA